MENAAQDEEPDRELGRTESAILAAYAELIEELGTDDVSFRLIARRAGVGERTVFRYFPGRSELILATAAWAERTVFRRSPARSVFDLPLTIRETMDAYGQRPELAHVVAETAMRGVSGAEAAPMREQVEGMLRREVPSAGEPERRAVAAALCHLDSAATWVAFRRELGMERRDIVDAAGWAAEAVLNPLRGRTRR